MYLVSNWALPNIAVSQVELSINNSLGLLPLVTPGEVAQFRLPLEMIWHKGQNILWTLSKELHLF